MAARERRDSRTGHVGGRWLAFERVQVHLSRQCSACRIREDGYAVVNRGWTLPCAARVPCFATPTSRPTDSTGTLQSASSPCRYHGAPAQHFLWPGARSRRQWAASHTHRVVTPQRSPPPPPRLGYAPLPSPAAPCGLAPETVFRPHARDEPPAKKLHAPRIQER